jgi:hypothetical protein
MSLLRVMTITSAQAVQGAFIASIPEVQPCRRCSIGSDVLATAWRIRQVEKGYPYIHAPGWRVQFGRQVIISITCSTLARHSGQTPIKTRCRVDEG